MLLLILKRLIIIVNSTIIKTKLEVGDYVRNADKQNIFSKRYNSNWKRELFKVDEVLKTQPPLIE